MTIQEAKNKIKNYYKISSPKEKDDFIYVESLKFLIEQVNEPRYMMELGGYYYEKQNFELALKYYEMASLQDYENAYECLGYIWYYGRTGIKDYEKAFMYFRKASERGNIIATYKLADMYKNGYGVEKDYEKYKKIIKELYKKLEEPKHYGEPFPEIYTRLAKIYIEEGKKEEAKNLLIFAKEFLAMRISYNAFFGNFTIMKYLVEDLYTIQKIDYDKLDLYDFYEVLKQPHIIIFYCEDKKQQIESILEDGEMVIKYNEKWYRTIDDFYKKAKYKNELLVSKYTDTYDFKLLK